jgi:hypothetical protein
MPQLEGWILVRGIEKPAKCDFCWNPLKARTWAYKSTVREVVECQGCRKEGWRAEKAALSLKAK